MIILLFFIIADQNYFEFESASIRKGDNCTYAIPFQRI